MARRRSRSDPFRVAAALLLLVAAAWGDAEEAAELFAAASAAYQRGDYRAAARAYEAAYARSPHSAALYNAARAWLAAGEPTRAADGFEAALERGQLQPQESTHARRELAKLEPELGHLSVSGPPSAKIRCQHIDGKSPPLTFHTRPGSVVVHLLLADGKALRRRVQVAAGQTARVAFDAPEQPLADSRRTPAPVPPPRERAGGAGPPPVVGWSLVGAGVLGSVATVWLGRETVKARDDFYATGKHDAEARDKAVSLRTWTAIAAIASVAATGAGITLLVVGNDRGDEQSVVVGADGVRFNSRF